MTGLSVGQGVVATEDLDEHMQKVQARLAEVDRGSELEGRVNQMSARVDSVARKRLLDTAVAAKTQSQRIHWLRRQADLLLKAADGLSPCSSGCSHCCHIGVLAAEPEAIAIGKVVGRAPAKPPLDRVFTVDQVETTKESTVREAFDSRHFGKPCPFLDNGRCSIYEHRPLACRHLISMDRDDLLCRLVPGARITVPYVNTTAEQFAYLLAMGGHSRIADIRDWFPSS